MNNDLISRSALIEAFWADIENGNQLGYGDTEELIKNAPAVDAVEVVRCKDCKWLYRNNDMCCCTKHTGHGSAEKAISNKRKDGGVRDETVVV